ncbi:hypothetical protein AAE478_002223 [Parahypoxylon ruwenzoriense]
MDTVSSQSMLDAAIEEAEELRAQATLRLYEEMYPGTSAMLEQALKRLKDKHARRRLADNIDEARRIAEEPVSQMDEELLLNFSKLEVQQVLEEMEYIRYEDSITYGVELQFLVPVLTRGQPDPHPDDARTVIIVDQGSNHSDMLKVVSDTILRILRTNGLPAWTHLGPSHPDRKIIDTMDQESQAVSRMPAYSQWVVEIDQDLVPIRDQFSGSYTWVGVKAKSNKRDTAWEGHFDQVGNVIVALRNTLRLRVPSTTSLMVHVGLWDYDIMTYEGGPYFLRIFCTLWWFVEKYVQSLVHPSRRMHPECQLLTEQSYLHKLNHDELYQGLVDDSMGRSNFGLYYSLMQKILPHTSVQPRAANEIEYIWRAKDGKTLAQSLLVSKYELFTMQATGMRLPNLTWGRGAIGLQGFCERAYPSSLKKNNDGETGTIEFRSMEGTLDPLLVLNWLAVVTRLFDISRRGNHDDVMGIIHKAGGTYNGIELLKDLDLPEQASYFQEKIVNQETNTAQESMSTLFVPPYSVPLS